MSSDVTSSVLPAAKLRSAFTTVKLSESPLPSKVSDAENGSSPKAFITNVSAPSPPLTSNELDGATNLKLAAGPAVAFASVSPVTVLIGPGLKNVTESAVSAVSELVPAE